MVCSRSYFYITNMGNRIGFWTVHSSFQPWWIKINWQRTFLYYRLLHLILLAFNAFSVWSLSVISGDRQSVFAKKENTNAVVLVASQVRCAEYSSFVIKMRLLWSFASKRYYIIWQTGKQANSEENQIVFVYHALEKNYLGTFHSELIV